MSPIVSGFDLNEPISLIMEKNVISGVPNDSVMDILKLMDKYSIRHIPILSGKYITGIISKSDIESVKRSCYDPSKTASRGQENFQYLLAENIMSKDVKTISQDHSIKDVLALFTQFNFHALPILDSKQELCGIITVSRLLKYFMQTDKQAPL